MQRTIGKQPPKPKQSSQLYTALRPIRSLEHDIETFRRMFDTPSSQIEAMSAFASLVSRIKALTGEQPRQMWIFLKKQLSMNPLNPGMSMLINNLKGTLKANQTGYYSHFNPLYYTMRACHEIDSETFIGYYTQNAKDIDKEILEIAFITTVSDKMHSRSMVEIINSELLKIYKRYNETLEGVVVKRGPIGVLESIRNYIHKYIVKVATLTIIVPLRRDKTLYTNDGINKLKLEAILNNLKDPKYIPTPTEISTIQTVATTKLRPVQYKKVIIAEIARLDKSYKYYTNTLMHEYKQKYEPLYKMATTVDNQSDKWIKNLVGDLWVL